MMCLTRAMKIPYDKIVADGMGVIWFYHGTYTTCVIGMLGH